MPAQSQVLWKYNSCIVEVKKCKTKYVMSVDEETTNNHGNGNLPFCNPGDRIRIARHRSGLSQEELAEKLHVERKLISRIENNEGGIRLRTIQAVLCEVGLRMCAHCSGVCPYRRAVLEDDARA